MEKVFDSKGEQRIPGRRRWDKGKGFTLTDGWREKWEGETTEEGNAVLSRGSILHHYSDWAAVCLLKPTDLIFHQHLFINQNIAIKTHLYNSMFCYCCLAIYIFVFSSCNLTQMFELHCAGRCSGCAECDTRKLLLTIICWMGKVFLDQDVYVEILGLKSGSQSGPLCKCDVESINILGQAGKQRLDSGFFNEVEGVDVTKKLFLRTPKVFNS